MQDPSQELTVPTITINLPELRRRRPGFAQSRGGKPILADCAKPLVDEAPDLRILWQALGPEVASESSPDGDIQRIEQCGNRIVITSGGSFMP